MEKSKDPIGISLIFVLFFLIGIIGIFFHKSIDWDVLKRLEQTPLVLPTPITEQNGSTIATPSSTTITPNQTKN